MNRKEVLEKLNQVKELMEILDEKEVFLQMMKSIALKATNARDSNK